MEGLPCNQSVTHKVTGLSSLEYGNPHWGLRVGLCCWHIGYPAARWGWMRIPCWWTHTHHLFLLPLPLHSFWTSTGVAGKADICRSLAHLLLKSLLSSGCLWGWTFTREPNMLITLCLFQVVHPHHFPQTSLSPALWACSFQIAEYPAKLLAPGSVQATGFLFLQVTTKGTAQSSAHWEDFLSPTIF